MTNYRSKAQQQPQEPPEDVKEKWMSTPSNVLQVFWLNVLRAALLEFMNAKKKSPGRRKPHEHKAVDWINTEYARTTIELAGLDPDWFLEQFNHGENIGKLEGFSLTAGKPIGSRKGKEEEDDNTGQDEKWINAKANDAQKGKPRYIPKSAIDIQTKIERDRECQSQ